LGNIESWLEGFLIIV